jgi:23S rRNA (cytosine1962-C5)-methyltransferase
VNIKLNLQGARKAASGLPWAGVKDLDHFKALPPAGTLVRLQDALGNFLAHAVCDGPGAEVPYRVLSRLRHPEFNAAFFQAAVEEALRARRALLDSGGSLRLLHGEADGLPGVFAELHLGSLWISCLSPGMQPFLKSIEDALWAQSRAKALYRRGPKGWEAARGKPGELKGLLEGLSFKLRPDQDEPADFPLQHRLDLARLGELGLSGRALIAFSRRGAWAAAALKAGCESALCLERDTALNSMAEENLALNGLKERAEFAKGDALERLEKLGAKKERFGLVLADMPRRSKGARLNFQARRHAAGLAARAYALLAPGGFAAFSLAASELSQDSFLAALRRGAAQAKLEMEVAAAGRLPADFPAIAGFEEASLRRFLVLKHKALA